MITTAVLALSAITHNNVHEGTFPKRVFKAADPSAACLADFTFPTANSSDSISCSGAIPQCGGGNNCCWNTGDYYEATRSFPLTATASLNAVFNLCGSDGFTAGNAAVGISIDGVQIKTLNLADLVSPDSCLSIPVPKLAGGEHKIRAEITTPVPAGKGCVTLGDWFISTKP